MSLFDEKVFAIVDVETTGASPVHDRVIEIGILADIECAVRTCEEGREVALDVVGRGEELTVELERGQDQRGQGVALGGTGHCPPPTRASK